MVWEKKLTNWVNSIREKTSLPLRVELWNGKKFDFTNENPSVTIHVPGMSSLSYLLTPSLNNLGTAYVEGKIDVRGRLRDVVDLAYGLAGHSLKPEGKLSRVMRTIRHTKEKDSEAIRYHYDVSNEFYSLWLDPNMVYSCAYFENGDEDLATAQLKKIDHHSDKNSAPTRSATSGYRLRLGCAGHPRSTEVRCELRWHHSVGKAVRTGVPARKRCRAYGQSGDSS